MQIPGWIRRFLTRAVAIVPPVIVILIYGNEGMYNLLVFSQVILSVQLPFAVVPLIKFTSNPSAMGEFVSPLWVLILAWIATFVIVALNMYSSFITLESLISLLIVLFIILNIF